MTHLTHPLHDPPNPTPTFPPHPHTTPPKHDPLTPEWPTPPLHEPRLPCMTHPTSVWCTPPWHDPPNPYWGPLLVDMQHYGCFISIKNVSFCTEMQVGLTTYIHNTLILTFQVKFNVPYKNQFLFAKSLSFIHGGHFDILDLIMQLIFIHQPGWLTTGHQISAWNQ